MKLRIVVAPNLWQALASGCTAISILIALAYSINAAPLEYYHLLFSQRVHLQLISDRADMGLWAGALVLLTLVLASWRHHGWRTIVLSAAASLPPILASSVPWLPEDPLVVAGAAMMLLLIWTLTVLDRRFLRSTWFCLAGLFIMIEVLALGHWLIYPFYKNLANPAAAFEMGLIFSGFALVVPLFIVLVLSWIPLLLPGAVLKIRRGFLKTAPAKGSASGASKRFEVGLALVALAVSVLIGYFPYLQTTSRLVGGDIECCYMPMLLDVLANGPGAVQGSDRVFFYSLLYATHLTTGASAFTILMIMPAVLTVLTAAATFVVVRFGLQDPLAAITAALVSALSFNTTAAIFMDLFANWFANVLLLLTIGFLLCAFRGGRRTRLMGVLAIVASVLILFSHALVWWSMIAIVVLFGAACVVFIKTDRARRLALLAVLLAVNFLAYELRLTQGITTGIILDASMIARSYSALAWGLLDGSVYGPFWLNLNYFIHQAGMAGIFYANWPILALAIAGTLLFGLRARESERDFRLLLGAWMLVGAVLTVTFSNMLSPYYSPTTYMPLVWRGLFMIPIQILVGISLASLLGSRSGRFAYVLFVLVLMNYAFRTLALTLVV